MIEPCKNCHIRKMYAKTFDAHFWGEDCPYECEKYERWKEVQKYEQSNTTSDSAPHA